mmetsp:Transcript_17858/g.30314  ORF Transcript_17858/g.30314 Transcript_17858/m.30314 type:complete len:122 (+) Transcript_17858:714-1079(+)
MRKRLFPFPLKLSGGVASSPKSVTESIEKAIVNSSHFLLSGGRNIQVPLGRTEALGAKENVKNIMQGVLKAVSISIFAQERQVKHNFVKSVKLSTSHSIQLTLFDRADEEAKAEEAQIGEQ